MTVRKITFFLLEADEFSENVVRNVPIDIFEDASFGSLERREQFPKFSGSCLALRCVTSYVFLSVVVKNPKPYIFRSFSAVFPRSLDPACISACFFRKQISCSRFSDSTTEHFTRRSECETSLDQYRNRPGR